MSLNEVLIIGNLGRDPEVYEFPSGGKKVTLAVATNRSWTDKDGQKQERTEWHTVVLYGNQADYAQGYLHKGDQVLVRGSIETRSWDDPDTGAKRYKTEIRGFMVQGFSRQHDAGDETLDNDDDMPF